MALRSGNAASFLVEFSSGKPDGNITWSVLGPDGTVLDNGELAVSPDAVSATIIVPGTYNTVAGLEMTTYRDVVWNYTVAGEIVNGEERYRIDGRVPFGVTLDGVRNKLGLQKSDLPDDRIDLIKAFYDFSALVGGAGALTDVFSTDEGIYLRDAIEGIAALAILPTLQVTVAQQESSGTDTYKRQDIDWNALADSLQGMVLGGVQVVIPSFDPVTGFGAIFMLAPPAADAITGA